MNGAGLGRNGDARVHQGLEYVGGRARVSDIDPVGDDLHQVVGGGAGPCGRAAREGRNQRILCIRLALPHSRISNDCMTSFFGARPTKVSFRLGAPARMRTACVATRRCGGPASSASDRRGRNCPPSCRTSWRKKVFRCQRSPYPCVRNASGRSFKPTQPSVPGAEPNWSKSAPRATIP